MVTLDAGTLLATVVVVTIVLAVLLILTWLQNRGAAALNLWAVSFLLAAAAGTLWGARGHLPAFVALDLASVLRLAAYGLGWQAARRFAERPGSWLLAFAPGALWLYACAIMSFAPDERLRVAVGTMLVGAYSVAIAVELWQGSHAGFKLARPAAIVLALHGGFFLARAVASLALPAPMLSLSTQSGASLHAFVLLEALVVAVALAFLLVSAAKEQMELRHRRAAQVDPLTGIANRRGFFASAEPVLARSRREDSPIALLLLDLDHFKTINDTWGHQFGDCALRVVADVVQSELRQGDIAGRLGGEEFGVVLPRQGAAGAAALADRIRRAVAALDIREGEASASLTVSIGVAAIRAPVSLDALIAVADAALYRAKAGGRNMVEVARTPLTLAEIRSAHADAFRPHAA